MTCGTCPVTPLRLPQDCCEIVVESARSGMITKCLSQAMAGGSSPVTLAGTASDPIVLSGPVVIEGDIAIKGYVTGRGTIYAGRNVHVIGDLTYKNPPSWPKPMDDPEAVAAANAKADLVGLAAKGSLILGDYTSAAWSSVTRRYQTPPFTQPYVVDPSDAVNGYVTGGHAIAYTDWTYTELSSVVVLDDQVWTASGGSIVDIKGAGSGATQSHIIIMT